MTENFFYAAFILVLVAVFLCEGALTLIFLFAAAVATVLAILNGYGVLGTWQG